MNIEVHRPLGSVSRLRRRVYEGSVGKREELNTRGVRVLRSVDESL